MKSLDEAIRHCEEVAEQNETKVRNIGNLIGSPIAKYQNECAECAADHRQLAEWLTEFKALREYANVNSVIARYNEVYEKLKNGNVDDNSNELLEKSVNTLEKVMPEYRKILEENQNQKEQIAEYKRLLKSAAKIVKNLPCEDDNCSECVHNDNGYVCSEYEYFEWQHEEEALKLIIGDE